MGEQHGSLYSRRSRMRNSYLAGEDDDFIDRPGGFILQELADDETTESASPDDGEIFVPGHICRLEVVSPVLLFIHSFKSWAQRHLNRLSHSVTLLTKPRDAAPSGPCGHLLRI